MFHGHFILTTYHIENWTCCLPTIGPSAQLQMKNWHLSCINFYNLICFSPNSRNVSQSVLSNRNKYMDYLCSLLSAPSIFTRSFPAFVEMNCVWRGPPSALTGLQFHSVTFILLPDLWLICWLYCLNFLTTALRHLAYYGFQWYFFCAIKGIFLINEQITPYSVCIPQNSS